MAPASLLEGAAPRLLDEWQRAPELWNLVRRRVDASPDRGRFILTGSAISANGITRHTGTGRFLRLRQRTLSWWEKQHNPADHVSLSALPNGERPVASLGTAQTLSDVVSLLLQADFPAMSDLPSQQSAFLLRAYLDEVVRTDIGRIAEVRQDPSVVYQLVTSLARTVASEAKLITLASDLRAVAPSITTDTARRYLALLERLIIVEPQQAWSPKLRSRARLRTSPKLHLVDPALAAAALGATDSHLLNDLETLGLLFESAVMHDLNVYSSTFEGEVRHYRDSTGKEIDAIITLPDGRWAAIEVRLGGMQIPAAVRSLDSAVADIDASVVGEPAIKRIVTGTGQIATLDDGTGTCPLYALGP